MGPRFDSFAAHRTPLLLRLRLRSAGFEDTSEKSYLESSLGL
jgi:hypothetical protein